MSRFRAPAAMTRSDYFFASAFTLLDLVVCGLWYWFPPERYFDEIYYPRSAAEYLQWQPQFEWTHPPLTKLLIALSMLLWGGMHSAFGNTGYGWRFLNVVIGAATVFLLYAFAKRLTRSTLFACVAAALLVLDGFHFTQSRIATPEITVAFFSLLTLYAFYRYWETLAADGAGATPLSVRHAVLAVFSFLAGIALGAGVIGTLAHQSLPAAGVMTAFFICALYAAGRLILGPRPRALLWLFVLAAACGLGAASKWNALFDLVLVVGFAFGIALLPRPKWRLSLDAFVAIVMSRNDRPVSGFLHSVLPHASARNVRSAQRPERSDGSARPDVHLSRRHRHAQSAASLQFEVVGMAAALSTRRLLGQRQPVRRQRQQSARVLLSEIISLPNPLTWWFGLLSVPFLGYLAWKERSRGYLLLFAAYFIQWLPWIASPRMLFEYHFFPNDAVILLADTITLKWFWDRAQGTAEHEQFARIGLGLFWPERSRFSSTSIRYSPARP